MSVFVVRERRRVQWREKYSYLGDVGSETSQFPPTPARFAKMTCLCELGAALLLSSGWGPWDGDDRTLS